MPREDAIHYNVKLRKEVGGRDKPLWLDVGKLVMNTDGKTGGLYLNHLPYMYHIFLKNEEEQPGKK